MKTLRIALDWTPNVNHIGIIVALENGFYTKQGLDVQIVHPGFDDYALTPAKKLELRQVDFAITPLESVISLNNKENQVDAVAVYAILQEDLSSIAVLKSSGIEHPAMLDNKIYASYNARYEDHIVQALIRNDGGRGEIVLVHPEKLGIWNTLLDEIADATWIFDNWEGTEAENNGIELNCFRLRDFGIPYSYSPVITARKSAIATHFEAYSAFIDATRLGYQFAAEHHAEAAKLLTPHLTEYDRNRINLFRAIERTIPALRSEDDFGVMNQDRIHAFMSWLVEHRLESKAILEQILFTNELL